MGERQKTRNEDGIDTIFLEQDPRWLLAQRIASSSVLTRAAQLREILLYIVRQSILNPDDPLRESEIAHKALGRRADFNPLDDNIVRVQMAHLRKRLDQFYLSEGKDEEVILSVALGSYRPVFNPRLSEPPAAPPEAAPAPRPEPVEPAPAPLQESTRPATENQSLPRSLWMAISVMATLLLFCCIYLLINNIHQKKTIAQLQRSLSPWRANPSVAAFWSNFFDTDHESDLIAGDDSMLLMEQMTQQYTSFTAYINHGFPNPEQIQKLSPDARQAMRLYASKMLGSTSEFKLAQKILLLDPQNPKVHFFGARQFPPAFLKQNNVILIGGRISNPWVGVFEDHLNFREDVQFIDTGKTTVINRQPQPGEAAAYPSTDETGYCVVAYFPDPATKTNVLLLDGTASEATEAAGDFLSSEEQMASLLRLFHTNSFPSFEVLLKITQVRGTPLRATVEAYRVYPQAH